MVLDFNRIYIGTFLILVLYASFLLKLDYLILITITGLAFYDLYKSKFIKISSSYISLFFFSIYLFHWYKFWIYKLHQFIIYKFYNFNFSKTKFLSTKIICYFNFDILFNFYEIVSNNRNLFYFIFFISFLNDTSAYVFGKLIKDLL